MFTFCDMNPILYVCSFFWTGTGRHSPTAASLRRILEDYLEVDPASNSAVSQLLSASLLSKYFTRTVFSSRDLIFDIDEAADEVIFTWKYLCLW